MQPVDYSVNKAISVGLPLSVLIILLFYVSFDDPTLWLVLIVITHTLGYTHFILGFKYQLQAIIKSEDNYKLIVFGLLTLIGLTISLLSIVTGNIALLAIIAIGYFLLHGVLNEVTVMEKQFGQAPPRSLMVPLVFYLLPFFLLSLSHPSFFFTPQLHFLNPPPEIALNILQQVVTINALQIISIASLMLFCILVPLRLIAQRRFVSGLAILLVTIVSTYLFLDVKPINYVVLYFILLSYHFISWSLYFFQVYQQKFPERLPQYIKNHVVVIAPLVLLSALAITTSAADTAHDVVFNGLIFITFAMVHNTTSLLNEPWFQNLLPVEQK